jgi:hypothetical protein
MGFFLFLSEGLAYWLRRKASFFYQRYHLLGWKGSSYGEQFVRISSIDFPVRDSRLGVEGGSDGAQAIGAVDGGFKLLRSHSNARLALP